MNRSGKGRAFYGENEWGIPFSAGKEEPKPDYSRLKQDGWRPMSGSLNRLWVNEDGRVSRADDLLKNFSERNDQDILAKQSEDLTSDGNEATMPHREKSASVEEVMRLRQGRAKGQKFQRSDAKVRSIPLNAQTRQGELPSGEEEIQTWNETRKL